MHFSFDLSFFNQFFQKPFSRPCKVNERIAPFQLSKNKLVLFHCCQTTQRSTVTQIPFYSMQFFSTTNWSLFFLCQSNVRMCALLKISLRISTYTECRKWPWNNWTEPNRTVRAYKHKSLIANDVNNTKVTRMFECLHLRERQR